jgi:Flp pilus assembly protein CpaB
MSRSPFHRSPRARATQIAALLAAVLTVRLVATDVGALHRGAARYGAPRSVVLARADLELGARIAADDVRVVVQPSAAVPRGALAGASDAVGRIVTVPCSPARR